jgi:hypothetical protein
MYMIIYCHDMCNIRSQKRKIEYKDTTRAHMIIVFAQLHVCTNRTFGQTRYMHEEHAMIKSERLSKNNMG